MGDESGEIKKQSKTKLWLVYRDGITGDQEIAPFESKALMDEWLKEIGDIKILHIIRGFEKQFTSRIQVRI